MPSDSRGGKERAEARELVVDRLTVRCGKFYRDGESVSTMIVESHDTQCFSSRVAVCRCQFSLFVSICGILIDSPLKSDTGTDIFMACNATDAGQPTEETDMTSFTFKFVANTGSTFETTIVASTRNVDETGDSTYE